MRYMLLTVLLASLSGCADAPTTQPSDSKDRQEKALGDPFGYGPGKDFGKDRSKDDKKNDLKSDWEKFWNP